MSKTKVNLKTLDADVAEKVLGKRIAFGKSGHYWDLDSEHALMGLCPVSRYSNDLNGITPVLAWAQEKFRHEDYPVRLTYDGEEWTCDLGVNRGCEEDPGEHVLYSASDAELSVAVCLAALKAVS